MNDYTKGAEETDNLRTAKLAELASALKEYPADKKQSYSEALARCPDLLDDAFYLKFLRTERFNVPLAAKRVCKYWTECIALFGPTNAFLPLTLSGALRDDHEAARLGIFNVLPGTDAEGRSVVWTDETAYYHKKHSCSPESLCRFLWYAFHAALECDDAQKHGVVSVFFCRQPLQFRQFDRQRTQMSIRTIKGCLPLRLQAIHLCQPPAWVATIFPLLKLFLGERLRHRVFVVTGTTPEVAQTLSEKGVHADMLPEEIGGKLPWDYIEWMETRLAHGL